MTVLCWKESRQPSVLVEEEVGEGPQACQEDLEPFREDLEPFREALEAMMVVQAGVDPSLVKEVAVAQTGVEEVVREL